MHWGHCSHYTGSCVSTFTSLIWSLPFSSNALFGKLTLLSIIQIRGNLYKMSTKIKYSINIYTLSKKWKENKKLQYSITLEPPHQEALVSGVLFPIFSSSRLRLWWPGQDVWPLQPITGQAGPVWTNQSQGAHLTLSDWRPWDFPHLALLESWSANYEEWDLVIDLPRKQQSDQLSVHKIKQRLYSPSPTPNTFAHNIIILTLT